MRRPLALAAVTAGLGFIALSVLDGLRAAPPQWGTNVVIVDASDPALPKQAGVDTSGSLKVNCITGCSAGSGTGASDADNLAPVSTGLGSTVTYPFLFDGTNFDRWRGDSTNGAFANIKAWNGTTVTTGSGTATGALRVELPSNGTGVVGLNPGTNTIGGVKLIDTGGSNVGAIDSSGRFATNLGAIGGNAVSTGTGSSGGGTQRVVLASDSVLAANQSVNVAQVAGASVATGHGTASGAIRVELPTDGTGIVGLAAGSNTIGALTANQSVNLAQVGGLSTQTGNGTASGSIRVSVASDSTGQVAITQTTPGTTNGVAIAANSGAGVALTPTVTSAAGNSLVLKASAGNLYGIYATNLTATAGFLVVLNATSAPADGAITPLACVPLTANGVASVNYNPGPVARYSTGITAVVTSASTCFTKTTGVITAFIAGASS